MNTRKKQKSKSDIKTQNIESKDSIKRNLITKEIKDKAFYYYAKGLTCKEVAKLLDLSFRTVQNWQTEEKWTEKLNPNSIKEKCFELKKKGMSYKEVSKMFKISVSSVQRYVSEVKKTEKTEKNLKTQNKAI